MGTIAGGVASLFRVVDASDVEKTVLRDAERRVRNATIPRFTVASALGYGPASLGKFCADANSLTLRMAADAVRRDGQQLRESGVANLAARDRVSLSSTNFVFLLFHMCRCAIQMRSVLYTRTNHQKPELHLQTVVSISYCRQ